MEHPLKQQYTCTMHPQIIKDAPGNCPICGMTLVALNNQEEVPSPTLEHKKEAAVVQMDHNKMDHSKMKMNDKEMDHSKMSGGHGGHDHNAMIPDFKKRFFVVFVLSVPIILLSPMIQHWLGVSWQFTGSMHMLFALSSVVFYYGGLPFLKGWLDEMKT